MFSLFCIIIYYLILYRINDLIRKKHELQDIYVYLCGYIYVSIIVTQSSRNNWNIRKRKREEEARRFAAFDYSLVVITSLLVVPHQLSCFVAKTMELISRRAIPVVYRHYIQYTAINFPIENRICVPIIPPNNTSQYSTSLFLSLSLSLCLSFLLASLWGESLTYFSILAQAFSILFVAAWHVSGCHY